MADYSFAAKAALHESSSNVSRKALPFLTLAPRCSASASASSAATKPAAMVLGLRFEVLGLRLALDFAPVSVVRPQLLEAVSYASYASVGVMLAISWRWRKTSPPPESCAPIPHTTIL